MTTPQSATHHSLDLNWLMVRSLLIAHDAELEFLRREIETRTAERKARREARRNAN